MHTILDQLPKEFLHFIIVTVFALLIGLSQKKIHPTADDTRLFGTDRTFTFIGILGFILYVIDNSNHLFFIIGGLVLSIFLSISYINKIKLFNDFGITSILIALITYCLAPLVITQAPGIYILVVVIVLVLTEMKETFSMITSKFDKEEFLTLAKFLVITGIILPIVPDTPIMEGLSLTPYKIWLAVVVISSISYLSYLLKKFVFKDSGIIISGILGGAYSSTATTIIMSKKCKEDCSQSNKYAAAILYATSLMYLRIGILMLIFNPELFAFNYVYYLISFIVTVIIGVVLQKIVKNTNQSAETIEFKEKNPLEFKVAILFTVLFIAFSFITFYTIQRFGAQGLNVLSFIVGFSDIDPFLINLFQGKYSVTVEAISCAAMQAIISNNILKLIYSLIFGYKNLKLTVFIAFAIIIVANIIMVIVM